MTALPARPLDVPAPRTPAPCGPAPRPDLSFVIPAHNEAENIEIALREISAEATRLGLSHEIIVVDDGSRDDTFDRACALTGALPLRVLRLSRNFGKEQAMSAGLEATTGAVVVSYTLDDDLTSASVRRTDRPAYRARSPGTHTYLTTHRIRL